MILTQKIQSKLLVVVWNRLYHCDCDFEEESKREHRLGLSLIHSLSELSRPLGFSDSLRFDSFLLIVTECYSIPSTFYSMPEYDGYQSQEGQGGCCDREI